MRVGAALCICCVSWGGGRGPSLGLPVVAAPQPRTHQPAPLQPERVCARYQTRSSETPRGPRTPRGAPARGPRAPSLRTCGERDRSPAARGPCAASDPRRPQRPCFPGVRAHRHGHTHTHTHTHAHAMVPMATQIAPQPFSLSPRSLLYAGISSSPGRSNPKSPHLRRRPSPAPPPGRARDPRRAGAARPLAAPRGSGGLGSLSATNASPGPPGLGTYPTSVCRKDGWIRRKLQTGPPVNATQPSWQQDDLSAGPLRTYLVGLTDPQTLCPRLLLWPQGPSPRALGPEHPHPGLSARPACPSVLRLY